MKTTATATCVGAFVALVGAPVQADTAPFDPGFDETVAEAPWSSSWIPSASAPVRLQLHAVARQDTRIAMTGDARFEVDDETLTFRGTADGGTIRNRIDVDVTAVLHVSFLGSSTQSEVGTWTIEREIEAGFTPYLLLGNTDAPVELSDDVAGSTLADVPIEVGPASGRLIIDWRIAATEIAFSGTRIDLYRTQDTEPFASASTEHEFVELDLGLEPGTSTTFEAIEVGRLDSRIALVLEPRLEVSLADVPVTIEPTEAALEFPVLDAEEITFEPVELTWMIPEAPAEGTTGGLDPQEGDSESSDSADSTGAMPPGPDGSGSDGAPQDETSSSGGTSASGATSDGGCSCSSGTRSEMAWLGPFGFGLFVLGMRRRH